MNAEKECPNSGRLATLFAGLLPLLERNHDFLEELHLQAVEMDKQGLTTQAQHFFKLVEDRSEKFPTLRAWACFKQAEQLLRSGVVDGAREMFLRVLKLNPGHLNARLRLHPPDSPLRVCLGENPKIPSPVLHMGFNYNRLELWDYYFRFRPVDELWLLPPMLVLRVDPLVMRGVAERYMSADAILVLSLGPQRHSSLSRTELLGLLREGDAAFRDALENVFSKLLA